VKGRLFCFSTRPRRRLMKRTLPGCNRPDKKTVDRTAEAIYFAVWGSNERRMVMKVLCVLVFALFPAGFLAMAVRGAEDKPAPVQQQKHFEKEITIKVKLNYLLFLPEGYGKKDKKWPLILFLHGAGETGNNLAMVKKHGPPKIVEKKKDFPFIVVSPQASRRGWNPVALNALLDDIVANYEVDKDRIYLTGLSMGGYGTWALAAAYPKCFAANVPICGGGNPADAKKLKNLAIWVFHGGKDPLVPVRNSKAMVDAIKKAGGKAELTIYPEARHDSWTETYNNPKLYEWLLKQKRKAPK
jgi:predicted peptidase